MKGGNYLSRNISASDLYPIYFLQNGNWKEYKIQIKGSLLSLFFETKPIKIEVLDGFHFSRCGEVDIGDGKKLSFKLHNTLPLQSREDLTFAVGREADLREIEAYILQSIESTALIREQLERKKKSSSTSSVNGSGWLHKSNRIRKRWSEMTEDDAIKGQKLQKRWFVLDEDRLYYFESPEHLSSLGVIDLPGFKLIKEESFTRRPFTFVVETKADECFFLTAEDQQSFKMWIKLLKKYHKLDKQNAKSFLLSENETKSLEEMVVKAFGQDTLKSMLKHDEEQAENEEEETY